MKNHMLKFTALTAAVVFAVSAFTGCQKKKTGATLEVDLTKSYRSEQILVGEAGFPLYSAANGLIFEDYDNSKNCMVLSHYDARTGEAKELELAYQKDAQAGRQIRPDAIVTLPDDKIAVVYNDYKLGSNWRPTDVQRVVEVYDADMQYLELIEIPDAVADGTTISNNYLVVDSDGNWLISFQDINGNTVLDAYDSEFQKYGSIRIPAEWNIQCLFLSADGTACACLQGSDASGNIYKMLRLDARGKSYEEMKAPVYAEYLRGVCTGTNGYEFYYYDDEMLWGVKENTAEEIISFTNSDFCNGIYVCEALENGQFVTYPFTSDNQQELWLLNKRTAEEIENMQLITLATLDLNWALEQAVVNYNRASKDCRIFIKDYAEYNEIPYDNTSGGMQKFKEDMLSGVVADMICTDNLNFESLASKGLFEDWYDVMEKDKEFNRDEYLPNFFEAYESGDELLRLGTGFHILTYAAKTAHVGDRQSITPSELSELAATLPEGMELYEVYDKTIMASNYFHGGQNMYIDREKAKCYFDTPEFIDMLELFAAIPDNYRSSLTELCYREDKVLLCSTSIDDPIDYHALARTTFANEEFTLIGYPMNSDDGNGGIFGTNFTVSLNAHSKQQAAAWDFMKYLLSEEQQKKSSCMPVHLPSLEYKMELATKQTMAKTYFNGTEVNIGAATEEEMATLMEYIKGIETSYYHDRNIYNIIMEEAEMCFSGDCTAQEAAKKIQSRVDIYINEQS